MPNTIIKNKKIEHLWSVLSGSSSVDQNSNSLSIFNVVEEITINTVPQIAGNNPVGKNSPLGIFSLPINLTITSLWQRNDDDKNREDLKVEGILEFLDPKGKILITNPVILDFKKEFKRLRAITVINGISFTTQGEYRFVLKTNSEKKGDAEEITSI
ncbi:MAG TPA: hypothetical protein VGC58_00795, partial [Candidatus Paceibacterota bacterium]